MTSSDKGTVSGLIYINGRSESGVWEGVRERKEQHVMSLTWVVGYDYNTSVESFDGLCEGSKGLSVQVVGGFVKHDDVWAIPHCCS